MNRKSFPFEWLLQITFQLVSLRFSIADNTGKVRCHLSSLSKKGLVCTYFHFYLTTIALNFWYMHISNMEQFLLSGLLLCVLLIEEIILIEGTRQLTQLKKRRKIQLFSDFKQFYSEFLEIIFQPNVGRVPYSASYHIIPHMNKDVLSKAEYETILKFYGKS